MVTLVSGTIGIVAAFIIVMLIRRDHLHVRYGLWWIAVAAGFVVFGIWPMTFDKLASMLGVAYGPVLALTLALTVLVIKILVMDIGRSRTEVRVQRLVQRVAMLESEIERLRSGDARASGSADSIAGDSRDPG